MTHNEYIKYLDFKTLSYVINVCLLKTISLMVMDKNGIGKTKLAECFAKMFSKSVIPVGAIDMGGLRQILAKEENQDKTHLIISDLQAFNRSRESRQKLISYIVNLTTDNSFFDLSYDLSSVLIPLPSSIAVRKKEQILSLLEGLYEIGYNGQVSIYNHSEQPVAYDHYYDRVWLKNPLVIEINQSECENWSKLLRVE